MHLRRRHLLFVLLILAAWLNVAGASGWNDYQLTIDPGYKICRANSLDVCLGHSDGQLIYVPSDYAQTGPINAYNVTPTHIFLHTHGRTPRNLFEGDTFENVDPSQQFFFVLDKSDDRLTGPFTIAEFQKQPGVPAEENLQWTEPRNPNAASAAIVGWIFLSAALLMIGWPIFLIVGVAGLAVFVVRAQRRKLHGPS
ncbi:hypothetical protein, partial [Roseimaritima sediminicola]|uniref:hypothetical protein n=1 Tax=Roseimaritima sediminicola TaxID=2662066 RepID=UPI0012982620